MNTETTPRHALSQAEFFKAASWAQNYRKELEGVGREKVGHMIKEATGVHVTNANLVSIEKAIGYSFMPAPTLSPRDNHRLLARAIVQLYERLGETPDPRVLNLATR